MAKKTAYREPIPTELIITKDEFKTNVKERIKIGEELFARDISTQIDFDTLQEEYNLWNDYNSEYLKQSFNNENNEYRDRYDKCAMFVGFAKRAQTPNQKLENFKETIKIKVTNLKKLEGKIDLLKCRADNKKEKSIPEKTKTNNVFIVHGHNERIKLDVARTIEKLGLIPIILSEKPNEGQTIIEKFELHSNVGYAVILLTGDDLGKIKTDKEEKYRARQNVILEMGYFIGKLGRNKVFPLYESGVELPSDLHGILYNAIDDGGSWKFKLAKELSACGYNIDANKLL